MATNANPEPPPSPHRRRRPRRRRGPLRPGMSTTAPPAAPAPIAEADAKELSRLLDAFLLAPDLPGQVDALERLVGWTKRGAEDHAAGGSQTLPLSAVRRTLALVDLVERNPTLRGRVQAAVGRLLESTDSVGLYSEAGIPRNQGFLSELLDNISYFDIRIVFCQIK